MINTPALSDPAYHIETVLGSGGGGVVYKAWHTRLKKYVVIKELKSGSAIDVETQRNEVEALKNVKSAYLPQVYDFLTEGGRIFTVIEFIEGESLDIFLERGQTFTKQQIIKWYGQLTSALEAIHKQDVCHCDIKPANIMLTPGGDVCLIDFNAALVSGNDVRLISRSLGYASPEQYEIYERYKNACNTQIQLGSSSVNTQPTAITETELLNTGLHYYDRKTEIVNYRNEPTELLSGDNDVKKTEFITPPMTNGIDWKRSDVYSLGATMYHLLSGKHPPQRASEVIAISKLGRFSEGIVYVIEQSMHLNPSERFASAAVLADVVRNIHKHDTRWKVAQSKKIAAAVVLPFVFALFAATAIFGNSVMVQEKEERYYSAVHDIENGADPQGAYNFALAMFWDRIDPYRAMAERLWIDGGIETCRAYIEQNLGNITKFQIVPEAARSFGDIYYILGNCYYYQSDEPDYYKAMGYFKVATQFVNDNPAYFRDYAISLARTGNVFEAGQVLEKARTMNLGADSLNLSSGEIYLARQEYDNALDNFRKVISLSNDDYLRYRAYHASDEVYKLLGQPENSVALLSGSLNHIPIDRIPEMTERLADAYVKNGDFESAITLFEKLSGSGAPQFHIMQDLAILLQNIGEFDRAASILNQMSEIFPNDYRVPMRQAYLEADRQSMIVNEKRDYTLTKHFYDNATKLYNENTKPGENDAEMQQLDLLIEQLRVNKWFD